jgi:hypothetical protein
MLRTVIYFHIMAGSICSNYLTFVCMHMAKFRFFDGTFKIVVAALFHEKFSMKFQLWELSVFLRPELQI